MSDCKKQVLLHTDGALPSHYVKTAGNSNELVPWEEETLLKRIAGLLALTVSTTFAYAEPITITQVFSNVDWNDYGVTSGLGYGQEVTGDWVFKGTVDTTASNEYGWPDQGASYAATGISLTQASLGLFDQPILNMHYLYFYSDQVGFAENTNSGPPWTRTKYFENHFDFAAFPLSADVVLPSSTHDWNGFGPQWDGFALANGSRIHGWGFAATSTVSVHSASPVPEPSSFLLVLLGLGALAVARRMRRPRQALTAA